jgi:hypothetical protein
MAKYRFDLMDLLNIHNLSEWVIVVLRQLCNFLLYHGENKFC